MIYELTHLQGAGKILYEGPVWSTKEQIAYMHTTHITLSRKIQPYYGKRY